MLKSPFDMSKNNRNVFFLANIVIFEDFYHTYLIKSVYINIIYILLILKVRKCWELLFHGKSTEEIGMKFGIRINYGLE